MEDYTSPRKIEEEHVELIEADRKRLYDAFDTMADMIDEGVLTMDQLRHVLDREFRNVRQTTEE